VKPYYEDEFVTLYHGRCEDVLPTLDEGSIGCVFTDPPYFRVKSDDWDRQWDHAPGFLAWLGLIADQWRRVLAVNGSLYCFASPQMSAHVAVMLADRFSVLNRIRWIKDAGWHNKAEVEALRSFLSPWEEVIFCEQAGQDTEARGAYTAIEAEIRSSVFEPLRQKLADMLAETGWTKDALNGAMGFAPHGMASARYFGRSQWQLPTPEHYATMQRITGGFRAEYEHLRAEYEHLRAEYEHLRAEYEHLRRPFLSSPSLPTTDVWRYPTVQPYPGKHPCEKPVSLIRDALTVSTRDGFTVLDCFAGSGSTLEAAVQVGRKAIGVEADEHYCEIAAKRLAQGVLDFGSAS